MGSQSTFERLPRGLEIKVVHVTLQLLETVLAERTAQRSRMLLHVVWRGSVIRLKQARQFYSTLCAVTGQHRWRCDQAAAQGLANGTHSERETFDHLLHLGIRLGLRPDRCFQCIGRGLQCAEAEVAGNAVHGMGNAFGRRAITGAKRGRELLPRQSLALGELAQQFDV
ncbi:hypothetical protein D3C81_873440 [compost metagenome]